MAKAIEKSVEPEIIKESEKDINKSAVEAFYQCWMSVSSCDQSRNYKTLDLYPTGLTKQSIGAN